MTVAARDRRRAEAFAAEHGVERATDSYAAVLADPEVEVVYNPLPNALHGPWNLAAVAAGKHVLSEKPFASTAEEAVEVRDAAQKAGRHGGRGLPLPVPPGDAAAVRTARLRRAGRAPARRRADRDAGAGRRRPTLVVRPRRRSADGPRLLRAARPPRAGPVGRWRAGTGRRPRQGTSRCTRRRRVAGGRPAIPLRRDRQRSACSMVHPHVRDDAARRGVPRRGDGHGLRPAAQGRPRGGPHRGRRDDRAPRHPLVLHLPARGVHPGAARRDADADRPGRRRRHRAADRPVLPRSRTSATPPHDPHARRSGGADHDDRSRAGAAARGCAGEVAAR